MTKPEGLVTRIKYLRNRMVEKQYNLEYEKVFSLLQRLSNPEESNTRDHMVLYGRFVENISTIVNSKSDKQMTKKHFEQALQWFTDTKDFLNFKHKLRGKDLEQHKHYMQDLSATKRLRDYITNMENNLRNSDKGSDNSSDC
jgi:hypothetical protein